jgi:hypothetical protein
MTTRAVSDDLRLRRLKTFFCVDNNNGYLRGMGSLVKGLKPAAVSIVTSTKEAPTRFGLTIIIVENDIETIADLCSRAASWISPS